MTVYEAPKSRSPRSMWYWEEPDTHLTPLYLKINRVNSVIRKPQNVLDSVWIQLNILLKYSLSSLYTYIVRISIISRSIKFSSAHGYVNTLWASIDKPMTEKYYVTKLSNVIGKSKLFCQRLCRVYWKLQQSTKVEHRC